jgi:hypothetical protein
MIAIIFGLMAMGLGIYGIYVWTPNFLLLLKTLIPAGLIFAGLIAFLAGISSLKK